MKQLLFICALLIAVVANGQNRTAMLPPNLNEVDSTICHSARQIVASQQIKDLIGDKQYVLISSDDAYLPAGIGCAGYFFNILVYNGYGALTCIELERDTIAHDYKIIAVNSYSSAVALEAYNTIYSEIKSQYGSQYNAVYSSPIHIYERYIYTARVSNGQIETEQCLPVFFKPYTRKGNEIDKLLEQTKITPLLPTMTINVVDGICHQMRRMKYGDLLTYRIVYPNIHLSRCYPTLEVPPFLRLNSIKLY